MANEELKKRQQEAIAKLMRGEFGPDVKLSVDPIVEPNLGPNAYNPNQVQIEPETKIEDTRPDFKSSTTGAYNDLGASDKITPQFLYQSNLDKAVNETKADEMALLGAREAMALEQQQQSRKKYEDAVSSLLSREAQDPSEVLRDMRSASASKPAEFQVPQEDLWSKAIASLGPALAGLAVGGYAGHKGGGEGGEKSMAFYADQRKQDVANAARMAEERSKRMVGQSQLAQAEAKVMQDIEQREIQKLEKVIGFLKEQGQQDTDLYKMAVSEFNKKLAGDKLMDSAKTVADYRQKEVDNAQEMEKAQLSAETQKAVAKENAKGRANQAQNKPLTESQAKATFQYSMASQAENDLKQIRKTYGSYPSMDNRMFPTFKELSVGEYTDIAAALSSPSIPAPVREQIQSELLFLESIGRIQSGAAIGSNEWRKFEAQYFPRKGDNETTTQRKEIARQRALQAMGVMSGKGMNQVPPAQQVELKKDSQPKEMFVKGTKYILQPNGKYLPEKK